MSFITLDSVSSVYDTETNRMVMYKDAFGYWKDEVIDMNEMNDQFFDAMDTNDLTELSPYMESDVSSVGI